MTTRMEGRECRVEKVKRQARHLEERTRGLLGQAIMAHNSRVITTGKGKPAGNVGRVYFGSDMATIDGDKVVAELAAKLLRQGGYRDVTVEPHVSQDGVWTACGLI